MRALAAIAATAAAVAATTLIVGPGDGTPHAVGTPTVAQQGHLVAQGSFGGPPPSSPTVGDVLFTGPGHWSGSPTGFAYAWKDCDSGGANCTTAAGSPTNTTRYQIVSGDVGFTIRVAVTASYSGHPDSTVTSAPTAVVGDGTFPLSVSSNGRFIQKSSGSPFLMTGDSPQSLIGNNSVATAESYLDDRAAHGFNTVWINLVCTDYTFCAASGQTYDSVKPFTSGTAPSSYDVSTPNSTYFARAHTIAAYAATKGIAVVFDPMETGGWGITIADNSESALFNYGAYLGTTFGDLKNIIWMSGNDFSNYTQGFADSQTQAIANGIQSTDPTALQTLELYGQQNSATNECAGIAACSSLDDTTNDWTGVLTLNGAYTYQGAFAEIKHAYGQTSSITIPAFLQETVYEGEGLADGGTTQNVRLQEWWTMTSGGTGQLYGNAYTDDIGCNCTNNGHTVSGPNSFTAGNIDSVGVTQMGYWSSLLTSIAWQNLVPDTNGAGHLVTSGGGTCPSTNPINTITCVTAAIDSSGTLALVYDPAGATITIALSKFTPSSVTARWYDPTNGTFSSISGSPFTNTGTHSFATPGNNNAGDSDWALLLQAS